MDASESLKVGDKCTINASGTVWTVMEVDGPLVTLGADDRQNVMRNIHVVNLKRWPSADINRESLSNGLIDMFRRRLESADLTNAFDVCTLNTIRDIASEFGLKEAVTVMSREANDAMKRP